MKESKYIIKQLTQQKSFTDKAVSTMQTFRANVSSPSHISGGHGPAVSTGQTCEAQL